jgi:hypothetical protein
LGCFLSTAMRKTGKFLLLALILCDIHCVKIRKVRTFGVFSQYCNEKDEKISFACSIRWVAFSQGEFYDVQCGRANIGSESFCGHFRFLCSRVIFFFSTCNRVMSRIITLFYEILSAGVDVGLLWLVLCNGAKISVSPFFM